MAAAYGTEAHASDSTGSLTSLACNKPASTASGDLLVATISTGSGSSGFTAPAGWGRPPAPLNVDWTDSNDSAGAVFTKTAGASEPASYTFSWTTASPVNISIVRITGSNGTIRSIRRDTAGGTGASLTSTALSGTVSGDLIVAVGIDGDDGGSTGDTITPPASPWATINNLAASYKYQASSWLAGPQGSNTATFTSSSSSAWWNIITYAAEASGATPVTSTGAVSMGSMDTAGTTTVANPVTSTGAVSLGSMDTAGSATVANPVTSSGAVSLGSMDTAGSGTVLTPVTSSGAVSLAGMGVAGTGSATPPTLLISIAGQSGTDPETGTPYDAGIYTYGSQGSLAGLTTNGAFAELQILPPGPVTHETQAPAVLSYVVAGTAGQANEQMATVVTSGQESSLDTASVIAYSEAADGTAPASVSMAIGTGGFGSGIYAALAKTALTLFGIPLTITNQTIPAVLLIPTTNSHITDNPRVFAELNNANAANEQALTVLTSGKESGGDDAALQLFSETADATGAARAVIEFGGTVALTVTKTGISASVPVTADTWHTMSLGNGWAQQGGNVTCQYRLTPENEVEIIGVMTGAAATSNHFFTLPSGYHPASQQPACSATSTGWAAGFVQADASGNLTLQAAAHTGIWAFHGFISLDA